MILAVLRVFLFVFLGDRVASVLDAPIPGPIIGLAVLLAYLVARKETDWEITKLFQLSSPHFPLLFLPVAAGVLPAWPLISQSWFLVLSAVTLGTLMTLCLTGLLAQTLFAAQDRTITEKRTC